ncbi:DUF6290 family protein [Clostridium baratii]
MIKKDNLIQIRVTKKEKEMIEKFAYSNNMNMSDYIRYCIMKDRIKNNK